MTQTIDLLDQNYWSYGLGIAAPDLPDKANPIEVQYYDEAGVTVDNGVMTLSALPVPPYTCSDDVERSIRSGAIHLNVPVNPYQLHPVLTFTFEVALPDEANALPQIWLFPTFTQLTRSQVYDEIAVLKYTAPMFNVLTNTVTGGTHQTGPVDYGMDDPTDSHEYQIVWTAARVEFKLDGVSLGNYADPVPGQPLQLVMSLAMTEASKGASMQILRGTLEW